MAVLQSLLVTYFSPFFKARLEVLEHKLCDADTVLATVTDSALSIESSDF